MFFIDFFTFFRNNIYNESKNNIVILTLFFKDRYSKYIKKKYKLLFCQI